MKAPISWDTASPTVPLSPPRATLAPAARCGRWDWNPMKNDPCSADPRGPTEVAHSPLAADLSSFSDAQSQEAGSLAVQQSVEEVRLSKIMLQDARRGLVETDVTEQDIMARIQAKVIAEMAQKVHANSFKRFAMAAEAGDPLQQCELDNKLGDPSSSSDETYDADTESLETFGKCVLTQQAALRSKAKSASKSGTPNKKPASKSGSTCDSDTSNEGQRVLQANTETAPLGTAEKYLENTDGGSMRDRDTLHARGLAGRRLGLARKRSTTDTKAMQCLVTIRTYANIHIFVNAVASETISSDVEASYGCYRNSRRIGLSCNFDSSDALPKKIATSSSSIVDNGGILEAHNNICASFEIIWNRGRMHFQLGHRIYILSQNNRSAQPECSSAGMRFASWNVSGTQGTSASAENIGSGTSAFTYSEMRTIVVWTRGIGEISSTILYDAARIEDDGGVVLAHLQRFMPNWNVVPCTGGMKVFVVTLNSKIVTLNVRAGASIRHVKLKLQEAEHMHPEQQRLIYAGKQLEDECSLCDYGIHNEATLHLLVRLRGGMQCNAEEASTPAATASSIGLKCQHTKIRRMSLLTPNEWYVKYYFEIGYAPRKADELLHYVKNRGGNMRFGEARDCIAAPPPLLQLKAQSSELGTKQDAKPPTLGDEVMVTQNYDILLDAATRSGLSPNAARLGITGTVCQVDVNDGTVQFEGCQWWVPIAALTGYEEFQATSQSQFVEHDGYMSKGGDLLQQTMTIVEAKLVATQIPGCKGFCFRGPPVSEPVDVYFKSHWDIAKGKNRWTSYQLVQAFDERDQAMEVCEPTEKVNIGECIYDNVGVESAELECMFPSSQQPSSTPKQSKGIEFQTITSDAQSSGPSASDKEVERMRKQTGAQKLRSKGFSVRQLLEFYGAYHKLGQIQQGTTTNEVVRNIIIPETATPPRCYMDSDYMKSLGGGHAARKLVSHAWLSEFANTVLNIVLDASERPRRDFVTRTSWGNTGVEDSIVIFQQGTINTGRLLRELPSSVLAQTYWLCTFAVDEHHAICGDCWTCNKTDIWRQDVQKHLKANICLVCKKPKFNPCGCGSVKYAPGDPDYEIDLFDHVVSQVDSVVVSLDADLNSVKRVWVVAEIGQAMRSNSTVFFRLAAGLSDSSICKLQDGIDLMPSVGSCDSTSPEDKNRILSEIHAMDGGQEAYDQFINCLLELNFGVVSRLPKLQGAAEHGAANLKALEMDFTWQRKHLFALPKCSHLRSLKALSVNCRGCFRLSSLHDFAESLSWLKALESTSFDFSECEALTSINELGKPLAHCQFLNSVTFAFYRSGIGCINEFALILSECKTLGVVKFHQQELYPQLITPVVTTALPVEDCNFTRSSETLFALPHCPMHFNLQKLKLSCKSCKHLASVDEFGKGMSLCQALKSASFCFTNCSALTSVDELGRGLGECQSLTLAAFDFHNCAALTSVDEFGKGLGSCPSLTSAAFDFHKCTALANLDEFVNGLGRCQTLISATFDFHSCTELTSIDKFGKGLGNFKSLTSTTFDFHSCSKLVSIDGFGRWLGKLQSLTSAHLGFRNCTTLTSVNELGTCLGQCEALCSAFFDFQNCNALDSIDKFAVGLGQCRTLASVNIDAAWHKLTPIVKLVLPMGHSTDLEIDLTRNVSVSKLPAFATHYHVRSLRRMVLCANRCASLASVHEFGKALGQCQALRSATFEFNLCGALLSIDELGRGLGQCEALRSAEFDFSGCSKLTSIEHFGKGLGQSSSLTSVTFNFSGCSSFTSIEEFGKGLCQCQALRSVTFDFHSCTALTSVHEFCFGRCHSLNSVAFDFRLCRALTSIDQLGKSLGQCQSLQSATFDFSECSALTSIDKFAIGLGQCRALASVTIEAPWRIITPTVKLVLPIGHTISLEVDFIQMESLIALPAFASFYHSRTMRRMVLRAKRCAELDSMEEFGKALGQCQALRSAEFDFSECSALTSIDELGGGLAQCQALQSATFDFCGCSRLTSIDGFGTCLGQCRSLTTAAFTFRRCGALTSIDEFGKGLGHCQALWSSEFDFSECSALTSIDHFGKGLCQCQALQSAEFDFSECSALTSIGEFGRGLGQCQVPQSVTFSFGGCSALASIDEFGIGLGHCRALQSATFNFSLCKALTSIDEFGRGVGQCQSLTAAIFSFRYCSALTSISGFGEGLGPSQCLTSAAFDFGFCRALTSIDRFGKALGQCQALQSAAFVFRECSAVTSIDVFGSFFGQCQSLQSATFDFNQCRALASIDGFGKDLSQCQALQSAKFDFGGCILLTSSDEFGKGLGQCQALQSTACDFCGCAALTSIDEFGKGLGQCQSLTTASLNFQYCTELTTIDDFGKGLGQCHSLTSATLNFQYCTKLTSIDEFGKGFGRCRALQYATFSFCLCPDITSIDEFGKGLGQCHALQSATFDFCGCSALTSIDEFGKGLLQSQSLASVYLLSDLTTHGCDWFKSLLLNRDQ